MVMLKISHHDSKRTAIINTDDIASIEDYENSPLWLINMHGGRNYRVTAEIKDALVARMNVTELTPPTVEPQVDDIAEATQLAFKIIALRKEWNRRYERHAFDKEEHKQLIACEQETIRTAFDLATIITQEAEPSPELNLWLRELREKARELPHFARLTSTQRQELERGEKVWFGEFFLLKDKERGAVIFHRGIGSFLSCVDGAAAAEDLLRASSALQAYLAGEFSNDH